MFTVPTGMNFSSRLNGFCLLSCGPGYKYPGDPLQWNGIAFAACVRPPERAVLFRQTALSVRPVSVVHVLHTSPFSSSFPGWRPNNHGQGVKDKTHHAGMPSALKRCIRESCQMVGWFGRQFLLNADLG